MLKWIVVALGLLQGAWLVFDGSRALVTGDYVTPGSGPRAGQLGPWSRVVTALGINPRSTFIKCAHVILGTVWLAALVIFVVRPDLGWWAVLGCCVATLWYLPIGTVLSLAAIILLLVAKQRAA